MSRTGHMDSSCAISYKFDHQISASMISGLIGAQQVLRMYVLIRFRAAAILHIISQFVVQHLPRVKRFFRNQQIDKWKKLSLLVSSNSSHQCSSSVPGNLLFSCSFGELMIACCFCQAPRIEAQTILGSLVCFPNLYHQIPVLQNVPGSSDIVVSNEDIKVNLP